MSMSLVLPRSRAARSAVAALTAGALSAAGLVMLAPAAEAAPNDVTVASATWGFKQSFRSYISSMGTVTVTEGASKVGGPGSEIIWPVAAADGGSYDPQTRAGTIHFGGKVTFANPAHEMREVSIANLTVVLVGDGTGTLKADVARDVGGDTMPLDVGSVTQVSLATLSGVPAPTLAASAGGQTSTFSNITTTLTSDGLAGLGLGNFYTAGSTIDPLTISVEHTVQSATASTTALALSPSSVEYGRARTAKVTVTGAASAAGETVTVKEGTRTFGSVKLNSVGVGTVNLPSTLSVGRHTITATFPGSAGLLASSGTATLTVGKATTKSKAALVKKTVKVGKKGSVKATVTASGITPTGKVQIKEGKKVLKTATLSGGKKTITLPKLKKGKHKLVVRYLGSSVAKTSTSAKVTLTVKK